MEGWIKLHRRLLEWEWYDEPNTFRLFMHCLLKANHKDNNYRGQLVKAGSFLTSRDLLAKETGLTTQQVRTSLKRLETTNEITTKKSKKGTVLQVIKYVSYQHDNQQSNQQTNQQLTNNQPTANQQLTTNNNDNNDNNEKNEKEIIIGRTLSSFGNWKKTISSDEVLVRNLFQELLGKYTFLDLQTLHRELNQKLINYEFYYNKYKFKLNDEKHLKNSFKKFAIQFWNKNTTQIMNMK